LILYSYHGVYCRANIWMTEALSFQNLQNSTKFLIFYTLYNLKIIITEWLEDNSIYLIYIGDFTVIFMDICPTIDFHFLFISLSIKSLLISIYFYVNQNNGKLCWLQTIQLTIGLIDEKYSKIFIKNNF
jgi:hypothetical protein